MKYNKLIRDKVSESLRQRGISHSTHMANEKEYLEKLKEKYLEETKEFFKDNTKHELADILEVTYAFRDYLKYDSELLEALAEKTEYTNNGLLRKVKRFTEEPNAKKLGEVLGMIYSACDYIEISKEELESARQIKEEAKGGLKKKIILDELNK